MLAISERTLWELTNRADLPCVRLGRAVRYDPADLADWVERRKSRPSGRGNEDERGTVKTGQYGEGE
jgi:hypothetical protein